jgi:hypothetical protein
MNLVQVHSNWVAHQAIPPHKNNNNNSASTKVNGSESLFYVMHDQIRASLASIELPSSCTEA